jgi:MOSC domain-containing protein YiiM
MSGVLIGIYLGTEKGKGKSPCDEAELIPDHGMHGDAHAGGKPGRQLSLFSSEVLDSINAAGIDVTVPELSANLITRGIDLDSLSEGTQLVIGTCVIEITEARKPCGALTRIDMRLPRAAYTRCGKFARVITGGTIQTGSFIRIDT